jgi:hypothetical protein
MLRDLEQGKAVQLIGEKGGPRWHQVRAGIAPVDQPLDASFSIASQKMFMLDLLPSVPCEEYRIRAEMRVNSGDSTNTGIYFCCFSRPVVGPETWFVSLLATQIRNQRCVGLNTALYVESRPGFTKYEASPVSPFPPPDQNATHWHRLIIDVTKANVTATHDDKLFGAPTVEFLNWTAADLVRTVSQQKDGVVEFPAQGALGLLIEYGSADYRDLWVEPLPDGRR